ncbi:MAG: hypothetical protein C0175_00530 [Caldisericum exile]|uniref:Uncharacterized protein n=1 Tax=Caldisericum exile TaxID=693075 RepID=A0A2J6X9M0_9BACT|nr:MAG: hypothetical protein C0175_00530 [Caldisericum exile]
MKAIKMNNIHNKTTKDRFFTVSDLVINSLSDLNCLTTFQLYFYLSSKQTFKNGVIGVFEEVTVYDIAKYLASKLKKKIDITTVKYFLKKLVKTGLLKIMSTSPFLGILTNAEFAEDLNNLDELLNYVRNNEHEFQFHTHKRRATEFFAQFKIERLATLPPVIHDKEQALDTLIRSRPTRALPTPQQAQKAQEWRDTIDEDEFNPFAEHAAKNIKFIEDENRKLKEKNEQLT